MRGFQPHEVIPRGGNPHRATGVRAHGPRRQPQSHRDRRARGGAARCQMRHHRIRRRRGHRIDAKAREGQLRHMGFTQTNTAAQGGGGEHFGIGFRHPTLQQARAGFRGHLCRIKEILPRKRDPIEQSAPGARLGPPARGHRLCARPLRRQPGIDARAIGMGSGSLQIAFGQIHRTGLALANRPPLLGCRHLAEIHRASLHFDAS